MGLHININDISETAFLTLQCHAIHAQSKSPILNDHGSVKTLNTLKEYFQKSGSALHKKLFDDKVQKRMVAYV